MLLRIALVAVIAAFFVFALGRAIDHENRINCGPEGKPALNGTACIDKEPVVIVP